MKRAGYGARVGAYSQDEQDDSDYNGDSLPTRTTRPRNHEGDIHYRTAYQNRCHERRHEEAKQEQKAIVLKPRRAGTPDSNLI